MRCGLGQGDWKWAKPDPEESLFTGGVPAASRGKSFCNLNLGPINGSMRPGRPSSPSRSGVGALGVAAESLETPQATPLPQPGPVPPATDASPPHLARIPPRGVRMWVTPDRYESCLGEAVTQAGAPRPRSCRLTDGLGLRMLLWVPGQSMPPWGVWGWHAGVPRPAFSAEGTEPAEWPQIQGPVQNRGCIAVVGPHLVCKMRVFVFSLPWAVSGSGVRCWPSPNACRVPGAGPRGAPGEPQWQPLLLDLFFRRDGLTEV